MHEQTSPSLAPRAHALSLVKPVCSRLDETIQAFLQASAFLRGFLTHYVFDSFASRPIV
jgi:hypothetical protein